MYFDPSQFLVQLQQQLQGGSDCSFCFQRIDLNQIIMSTISPFKAENVFLTQMVNNQQQQCHDSGSSNNEFSTDMKSLLLDEKNYDGELGNFSIISLKNTANQKPYKRILISGSTTRTCLLAEKNGKLFCHRVSLGGDLGTYFINTTRFSNAYIPEGFIAVDKYGKMNFLR